MKIEILTAFNNWEGNPRNIRYLSQFEAARDAWEAAWNAAQSARNTQDGTFFIEQFKADRALLRDKIMDKAVDAFRNGLDEKARLYRELANELFGKQA